MLEVDGREELLDRLAVGVGDLGRRRRPAATTVVDALGTSATCSAMVGEKPLKPAEPAASLMHDEVAVEAPR